MKLFKTTLTSLVLGGSLYASPFFFSSFDDDFSKIDRYFDSMFKGYYSKHFSPKMEMYDNKDNYVVEFEVQGIEKNDLKLSLEDDNILKLIGEKKSPKAKETQSKKDEKYYGTFTRMIQLPDDANGEKLTALHKNGILSITIPKKEVKEKPSKIIEIK
jgi:HSP20 family protein